MMVLKYSNTFFIAGADSVRQGRCSLRAIQGIHQEGGCPGHREGQS